MKLTNFVLLALASLAIASPVTEQAPAPTNQTDVNISVDTPPVSTQDVESIPEKDEAPDQLDTGKGQVMSDDANGDAAADEDNGDDPADSLAIFANATSNTGIAEIDNAADADAGNVDKRDLEEAAPRSEELSENGLVKREELEARGRRIKWCVGPWNVGHLRIGCTCPYFSRIQGHRFPWRKLHADLRVWKRIRRGWMVRYQPLANMQATRYRSKGRDCGYVRDKVTGKVMYDRCQWGGNWYSRTVFEMAKVMLRQVRRYIRKDYWSRWLQTKVLAALWGRLTTLLREI